MWLTELDLQLTNVEHFSESDVHHKIQQLNVRCWKDRELGLDGAPSLMVCLCPEFPEGDHAEHGAHRRPDRVRRGSDQEKFTSGCRVDRGRAGGAPLVLPGGFQQAGPFPPAPEPACGEPLNIHPLIPLCPPSILLFPSSP